VNRRDFLIASGSAVITAFSGLYSGKSLAFFPFLLRLMLGVGVRGTVTGVITRNAARQFIKRQLVRSLSVGINATAISAVTEGLAYAYKKSGASALWLPGDNQQNLIIEAFPNQIGKREQIYVGYKVTDVASQSEEQRRIALSFTSNNISTKFTVTKLPYATGLKLVEGLVSFDPAGKEINPHYVFTQAQHVYVADPEDVEPT